MTSETLENMIFVQFYFTLCYLINTSPATQAAILNHRLKSKQNSTFLCRKTYSNLYAV